MASHNPRLKILLDRLDAGPFPVVDLRGLVREKGGIRYGTSSPPPILPPGKDTVPFVRATDIKEGEIQLDGLLYVHKEQPLQMAKCLLRAGEVIVVRSGVNTGDCASVPQSLEGAYGAYDLILRLREASEGVNPLFLTAFLDTEIGRTQLNVMKARSAQPHLNAEEVGSIRVPLPRPRDQEKLLAPLSAARGRRKKMLAGADALLASLDGFVLDQLGLTIPPPDGRIVYATRLGDARTRFDPDFHSPRFRKLREKIEHGNHMPRTIKSLCSFIQTGFAAGGEDQTNDPNFGVPHIRPLNISNTAELHFEGTKMVPRSAVELSDLIQHGEVLFNNTNSTTWVGKSVVFDADRECACSNHITRLRLANKDDNPYFLAALLNALRGLGFFGLLATNFNNQAGINGNTLEGVRLPWPDGKIQDKVAAELVRRRTDARRLRAEADALWEQAKVDFEAALLGPAK